MSEQQKYFYTQDGTSLFYRYRPAADGSSDKAIAAVPIAGMSIPAG